MPNDKMICVSDYKLTIVSSRIKSRILKSSLDYCVLKRIQYIHKLRQCRGLTPPPPDQKDYYQFDSIERLEIVISYLFVKKTTE